MPKIIVFEENGEIQLATLIDEKNGVCRENFTDIIPCPEELLKRVPIRIVELCKVIAPQYLYINSDGNWESTSEPIPEHV